MSRIAFIGLGIMGRPMALNLSTAGFEVVGYSRTRATVEAFEHAGGRGAGSIAEAVDGAGIVATMVPDTPDVESVLAGAGGVFENAAPGILVIDFSTIRPDAAAALSGQAAIRGMRLLDAPVSGGEQGAIDGTLSVMVGGTAPDFDAATRVLQAVGKTVVHVGAAGSDQTVKAANQLIVGGTIELVAEALVFLKAHGVDTAAAVSVLAGGLAGSTVLERKSSAMINHEFRPGFRIALHHKDMGIVTEAARRANVVLPLGATVAALVAAANARGDGQLDHSALVKVVESLSGRGE